MPGRTATKAIDLAQSAIGMIRCYGESAETEAIALVQKYERSNDTQACDTWKAIALMIRQGAASG